MLHFYIVMAMDCGDLLSEILSRYDSGEAFSLSKGRGWLCRLCANNSWVYMELSVQIDAICFPIN